MNHEYQPISGFPPFTAAACRLLLGEDAATIKEGRLVVNQTISGTGANHLGAVFLHHFYPFPNGEKKIHVTDPSWPNHFAIFKAAGLTPETYPYYDAATRSLAFDKMMAALQGMPDGSVVLLHACAHNPTGVDPSESQWREIANVFAKKRLFAFFDSAYQGFASGDPAKDAFAVRLFESRGDIPMLVCQSFAKNAGLYGERIGALHVVTGSPEQAQAVNSQLNLITRSEMSTAPVYGARIVAKILTEPELRAEWNRNIQTMSQRIIEMRHALFELLTQRFQTPGTWNHIVEQTGMFSFLGIEEDQCQRLVTEGHIYLVKTGRISMAGLNPGNVEYVAGWIDKVVRERANL